MKKIAFILLGLSLALTSCVKEGARGPQGSRGADGVDGRDGSTPLLYYFNIPVTDFAKEAFIDNPAYDYNDAWTAFSHIDNYTIQEYDLVMVFMHQTTDGGPDNYFQALPYNDYVDNSSDFNHYSYGIMDKTGDLIFSIRHNDGSDPFNNMNANFNIEYNVYIMRGTPDNRATIPASINISNEQEVKKYLGITESEKINYISVDRK